MLRCITYLSTTLLLSQYAAPISITIALIQMPMFVDNRLGDGEDEGTVGQVLER